MPKTLNNIVWWLMSALCAFIGILAGQLLNNTTSDISKKANKDVVESELKAVNQQIISIKEDQKSLQIRQENLEKAYYTDISEVKGTLKLILDVKEYLNSTKRSESKKNKIGIMLQDGNESIKNTYTVLKYIQDSTMFGKNN